MEKIEWGPNWEEILGGEFSKRSKDANLANFDQVQKDMVGQFENTFMMYLPRLCEHCLNPACVASCPSGSIYKREDDGIVLIDQDKCRGWRMCVSGCPYKKIYYNWQTGKAEKCIFCYPRIEAGQPTVCSETCVGRIRYLGVVLYDADRIAEAASVPDEKDLYQAQLDIFLNPHDPKVIAQARKDGIPEAWLEGARNSPVYKMAIDWKVALPLHPEYRTLPMVWYVPPLSPITSAANAGHVGVNGELPDLTDATVTDAAVLRDQLAEVRRAGLATSIEEAVLGDAAAAVPVHDEDGRVIAALGVLTAAEAFPPAEATLRESVQAAPVRVVGILCRRKLSLQALRALGPGSLIPLPQNVMDEARVETPNGQLLALGRLGEADGFHALRLKHAKAGTKSAGSAGSTLAPDAYAPSFTDQPELDSGIEPPMDDLGHADAFRDITGAEPPLRGKNEVA
jgi:Fe-S-cluster-containing dehydrogenase component/flagellar motor switch/type III secretory pathway protein FliN